ncbi:stage 0 sporulation family protein [Psychroflexus salinarum]|uniref:Stage 0 sporulation family protein n=1 Tax=Psychroflexus salinarum TaxID=546024 RepID=A0ABW3GQ63_9FLAO
MGCSSCSTGKDGQPKGCKNNGTCGTDGCNKLTVFDWLSDVELPGDQVAFDCVEVRFKNSRKEFFRNTENLTLSIGDIVATEASPGHDIGIVTLTGELVRVQMKKKNTDPTSNEVGKVYRKASQKDIDVWQTAREREDAMKVKARQIAIRLNLKMKISDIEFQGDGSKAVFYYTAEERVDFRQLIKEFAYEFKTRIEMRQIGFRQEAARLGGIGSCGRELCCSTWLTDFRTVKTSAARYQQLSLNPLKLAGQCGKLKCCLNYELDTYLEALKDFPRQDQKLTTQKGDAVCQKIDIFKGKLWYAYEKEYNNWIELDTDAVKVILKAQREKNPVASLEEFTSEVATEKTEFSNSFGQDSLTRFDKPKRKKTKNKRKSSKHKKSKKNNANS